MYLGQGINGSLAVDADAAGQGATDGSTRRKITAEREELRGAVINESMARMPNAKTRAVVAWRNRDKLSSAWLCCLPGPEGLSSPAFAEAMSLVLCMPSPVCKNRVGCGYIRG